MTSINMRVKRLYSRPGGVGFSIEDGVCLRAPQVGSSFVFVFDDDRGSIVTTAIQDLQETATGGVFTTLTGSQYQYEVRV